MAKSIRINRWLKKILIWRNKLSFKPQAFSFAEKMKRAENVLICLPAKIENLASMKEYLDIFADIFQNKKISVFLPQVGAQSVLSHLERYEVIFPQKEDLGIFSLPRREFIRRIKNYCFEIALNLDLDDGFLNSYLCLKSGALVRIGPKDRIGFPFHNLELVLSQEGSYPQNFCIRMAEMIRSLSPGFARCRDNDE